MIKEFNRLIFIYKIDAKNITINKNSRLCVISLLLYYFKINNSDYLNITQIELI